MSENLDAVIADALGATIQRRAPLSGGCIGDVSHLKLSDGRDVVAKVDSSANPRLDIEGDSHFGSSAQQHAAQLLAALHNVRGQAHGLERDTLIGSLHQPNPWTDSWIAFFRDHRILHMAEHARKEGVMGSSLLKRLERFCGDLDRFIQEPDHPSLLHGDVWTTNVLAKGGKITGFIDPAVYYGHPEIELAFTTLFGTFGQAFFDAYHALRPIPDGFFETRRDIYNLYPLLVHTRLFGSSYLSGVEGTIGRLGY
jgi:fructosamine-3-kinase